jgi:hypothetical protein
MEKPVPMTSKEIAGALGGLLTGLGVAVIILPLVWWLTTLLHVTPATWVAGVTAGISGPAASFIAGYIERKRKGPQGQ